VPDEDNYMQGECKNPDAQERAWKRFFAMEVGHGSRYMLALQTLNQTRIRAIIKKISKEEGI